jgi:hypothetical protein
MESLRRLSQKREWQGPGWQKRGYTSSKSGGSFSRVASKNHQMEMPFWLELEIFHAGTVGFFTSRT